MFLKGGGEEGCFFRVYCVFVVVLTVTFLDGLFSFFNFFVNKVGGSVDCCCCCLAVFLLLFGLFDWCLLMRLE